jgi:hypothetical protein
MAVKYVSSASPAYIGAADIMIGDMSDINYEYLLFDKPIVLLCNKWLFKNFPKIGIKTSIQGINEAVARTIKNPDEYSNVRKKWLNKTFYFPQAVSASQYILNKAINSSGYLNPRIILIHGGNITRESNLRPIYDEGIRLGFNILIISNPEIDDIRPNTIFIGAHFADLNIDVGYKVHLDHGLKGVGTANLDISIADYKKFNYFPKIDIHITAGVAGYERTKNLLLGPNSERAVLGAYPKADEILKYDSLKAKLKICKELELKPWKKIVIYAPAGVKSYEKPGGSLSFISILYMYKLSYVNNVNVIVKLKNHKHNLVYIPLRYARNLINTFRRKCM